MLDSIKHSIVLLQIAKNTAHPINGIYRGPIMDISSNLSNSAGLPFFLAKSFVYFHAIKYLIFLVLDESLQPIGVEPTQVGIAFGSECMEPHIAMMKSAGELLSYRF